MFSFFKQKPQQEETPKPKYILEPLANGKYSLKQLEWEYLPDDESFQYYKYIDVADSEEEGRKMIANLERPVIQL